jgi:NAD(P)H-hydrate epimerase
VTDSAEVAALLPVRLNGRDINKGSFGHVLVIAGQRGFAGAPVLVAEASARAGAGLVTLAIPEGIQDAIMARVSPVVMTRGLKQTRGGTFGKASLPAAFAAAERATVVALGPGMGESEELAAFVREFVFGCAKPLVIDADALNVLSQAPRQGASLIKSRRARGWETILTPHPGEMGRLLKLEAKQIQSDRNAAILRAVQNYGCVVLLKGQETLIASSDGSFYLNPTGNPGMATGGMGDALTGVIAALLAQRLGALDAVVAGVYLHGLAGDLVERAHEGCAGMIATDLIAHLPLAIAHCQNESRDCPGRKTLLPHYHSSNSLSR